MPLLLTVEPGVVAVNGGWATLPNSPAAVEDGDVLTASTSPLTFTLIEAAEGTEVLVMMLVGAPGGSIGGVSINSDASRRPLEFTAAVGGSACVAQVYHLQQGDLHVTVPVVSPSSSRFLCWAVIDDTNLIPTDWELFSRSRTEGNTCRTGFWTALDTGLIVGAATIVGGSSVGIFEPYDWTFIGDAVSAGASINFAYGDVLVAGTNPPHAFTGTIPANQTGEVYWFGTYNIGLRLRDAGSWSNSGGIAQFVPGPNEPPARQFPPPRPLPNLPPEPTPITVPTPPWIPTDGPYRRS